MTERKPALRKPLETRGDKLLLRDLLVETLHAERKAGTLLVTAYRYPEGNPAKGIDLTAFGFIDYLLDQAHMRAEMQEANREADADAWNSDR